MRLRRSKPEPPRDARYCTCCHRLHPFAFSGVDICPACDMLEAWPNLWVAPKPVLYDQDADE